MGIGTQGTTEFSFSEGQAGPSVELGQEIEELGLSGPITI